VKASSTEITTIDEYIREFPAGVRPILEKVRATIRQAAPEAIEKISYRVPTFWYNGNLVHFGGFKSHVGFFPTASGVAAFEKELQRYKHAKGSIQFALDEPMPIDLITRIVKFRVTQNAEKKKGAKPLRKRDKSGGTK